MRTEMIQLWYSFSVLQSRIFFLCSFMTTTKTGSTVDLCKYSKSYNDQKREIRLLEQCVHELEDRCHKMEECLDRLRLLLPAIDAKDTTCYQLVRCSNEQCKMHFIPVRSTTYSCTECKEQLYFLCPAGKHIRPVSFQSNERCERCANEPL